MALIFLSSPTVVEEPAVGFVVRLLGTDETTGRAVECCVAQPGLRKLGAKGISDKALVRAFDKHRRRIESEAQSKFSAGEFESLPDRDVVWVGPDDL